VSESNGGDLKFMLWAITQILTCTYFKLIPWSRVRLEKLIIAQLAEKLPSFY